MQIISVPLVKYVLPYHYSLIPSEAASNLARYDGIRFGHQPQISKLSTFDDSDHSALFQYIQNSKTESFGMNVKRRVMMGNFLMSSGGGHKDFNSNLVNAQKYRRMIVQQYQQVMKN